MYLAYIDESGNFDDKNTANLEYVLTAVIVHEHYWKKLQDACKELKYEIWQILEDQKSYEPPDDFELHLKQISNRDGHFECLKDSDEKWYEIMDEIYTRISWLEISTISSIVIKDEFLTEGYEDVHNWALTLLVERLQRFTIAQRSFVDECILLVLDSVSPQFDKKQRENIQEFVEFGTGHGWKEYPTQVIETPFFVDSHIHSGIQIADALSYLLRRHTYKYLERNPNAFFNKYSDEFMKKINHLFYRGTSSAQVVMGNGIKIFPHKYPMNPKFWEVFVKN